MHHRKVNKQQHESGHERHTGHYQSDVHSDNSMRATKVDRYEIAARRLTEGTEGGRQTRLNRTLHENQVSMTLDAFMTLVCAAAALWRRTEMLCTMRCLGTCSTQRHAHMTLCAR